jgi:anthranilate phosphoribosyltransferase
LIFLFNNTQERCVLKTATPSSFTVPQDVFGGAQGAVADALNLNAGVALAAAQVASTPKEGVAMAQEAQRSGKAAETMRRWVEVSLASRAAEKAAA